MYRLIVLSLFIILMPVIHSSLQCYECEEVRDINGELVSGNCSTEGGARIMTHCQGRCGTYVWVNRKFFWENIFGTPINIVDRFQIRHTTKW